MHVHRKEGKHCSHALRRLVQIHRYRVLEQVPFREKPLEAALRRRGIRRLTIKKRGVSVVPDELRMRISPRGEEESTLVLTRVAGKGTALLVEPI
jgi:hypothetical protein